jgi:hypothetical protein
VGAEAAPRDDATRLFVEGRELLKRGDRARACARFRESQALDPRVGTLLNVARCAEEEGHLLAAVKAWRAAVAMANANGDARVALARDRQREAEERTPQLEIRLGADIPPGADVRLDGAPVSPDAIGQSRAVDPGNHELYVSVPGRGDVHARVVLGERERRDVLLELPASAPVALVPSSVDAASSSVQPGSTAVNLARPAVDPRSTAVYTAPSSVNPDPTSRWMRSTAVVATALGAASLGVGAYFGIDAIVKKADSSGHCDATKACDAYGLDARQDAGRSATVATATLVAGSVLAAAGVTLLVLSRKESGPRVVASPRGASLVGSF